MKKNSKSPNYKHYFPEKADNNIRRKKCLERDVWWLIKAKLLLQKILISKVNFFFTFNLKSKLNLDSISFQNPFPKWISIVFFQFYFLKTFSISNSIP